MKIFLIPALLVSVFVPATVAASSIEKIQNIVVIYGENRSFDNLYGMFPGANGIGRAFAEQRYTQVDMQGKLLTQLPPTWDKPGVPNKDFPQGMPNMPFSIDAAPVNQGLDKKQSIWYTVFIRIKCRSMAEKMIALLQSLMLAV